MRTDVPYIQPPGTFGPADYATLAKVAQVPGSKILDCTRFLNMPMNLVEIVTKDWAAAPGSVPKLAIVLQIDQWAIVKMLAPPHLARLAAQKTELRLFYARQLDEGHVHEWVLKGTEPGDALEATMIDLEKSWHGVHFVDNVIEAVADVIRAVPVKQRRVDLMLRLCAVAIAKKYDGVKERALRREVHAMLSG